MLTLFVTVFVGVVLASIYHDAKLRSQVKYLEQYQFHPGLIRKVKSKHPELTDYQLEQVFQGLREYFYCCVLARRKMVSMPSQLVDDAWHEFILFTRLYKKFCQQAFGRFLHHIPAEAMNSPTQAQDGIKRAWRLSCKREGINPAQPDRLPTLFAIDADMAAIGGFIYSLQCEPGGSSFCGSDIGCGGGCGGDSG